jgi:hypothetical protein
MNGPARRKCLCCKEFYRSDHRDLRHQRYCHKIGLPQKEQGAKSTAVAAKAGETNTTANQWVMMFWLCKSCRNKFARLSLKLLYTVFTSYGQRHIRQTQ